MDYPLRIAAPPRASFGKFLRMAYSSACWSRCSGIRGGPTGGCNLTPRYQPGPGHAAAHFISSREGCIPSERASCSAGAQFLRVPNKSKSGIQGVQCAVMRSRLAHSAAALLTRQSGFCVQRPAVLSRAASSTSRAASRFISAMQSPTTMSGQMERVGIVSRPAPMMTTLAMASLRADRNAYADVPNARYEMRSLTALIRIERLTQASPNAAPIDPRRRCGRTEGVPRASPFDADHCP